MHSFLKQHWLKILCGVLLILCILLSINCYLLATKEYQYPEIVLESVSHRLLFEDAYKFEMPGIFASYYENNHVVAEVYEKCKDKDKIIAFLTEQYGDLVEIKLCDSYSVPY
jgi:hypothetical protein